MKAIFLCAYRRTGKDTFCNYLQSGDNVLSCQWNVFTKGNNAFPRPSPDIQRVAFADILKREVITVLDRRGISIDNIEENKDKPILPSGRTFRDLCIAHATSKRKENPDYWCQQALLGNIGKYICVTDWRFPNEYEYFRTSGVFDEITTIRLFRSDVPIPPKVELSEHSLDNIQTDFLLCPPGDEEKALNIFPQYKNYRRSCSPIFS